MQPFHSITDHDQLSLYCLLFQWPCHQRFNYHTCTCLLFQARGLVLEALELLASYNHFTLSPTMINNLYTCLLFQARGLVLEALELLASYNHFTLSGTMINGLVTKGFTIMSPISGPRFGSGGLRTPCIVQPFHPIIDHDQWSCYQGFYYHTCKCLLFQARGLVLEALELLASYNHFTLSRTMINGLVTKCFTSHIIQAANGETSKLKTDFKVLAFFKILFCTPGQCRLKWTIEVMQRPLSLCPLLLFTFMTFQKPLNRFGRNLSENKFSTSSTNVMFLGLIWQ